MSTHIKANKEDIAKVVIMPGDPLRAKMIAEKYLTNFKQINSIRNMFGYTGYYKDKLITVMGSGMGIPSIGIYSYELYNDYDVELIIRPGTCGTYSSSINLRDLFIVDESYSTSSYALIQNGSTYNTIKSDLKTNELLKENVKKLDLNYHSGRVYTTDAFYTKTDFKSIQNKIGCDVVEMEAFGLFHNAKALNKKAACILCVTDSFITKEEIPSNERETSFYSLVEVALNTAYEALNEL